MLQKKAILPQINVIPNKQNQFVWYNLLFILALLVSGRADAKSIIFAFFFETIIIGIMHVFKLYKVYRYNKSKGIIKRSEDGIFAPIFFSIHYGFFVAIQLVLVFTFFSFKGKNDITEPYNLLHNITYIITNLKGIKLVLLSLLISNIIDFYFNFIQNESYKFTKMDTLFFQPYLRVIVQQFAVIFGGFFMIFKAQLLAVAIFIIFLKALIDMYFINNISFAELLKKRR